MPGEALAYVGDYFSSQRDARRRERGAASGSWSTQGAGGAGLRAAAAGERAAEGAARRCATRYARRGDRGRGALHRPRPVRAEGVRRQGRRRRHRAGRGGDRRRRRGRPGDARVPVHGRSDAGHRQGPGGAGARWCATACARVLFGAAPAARSSCASRRPTPRSRSATCWSPPASTAPIRRASRSPGRRRRARHRPDVRAHHLPAAGRRRPQRAPAGARRRPRRCRRARRSRPKPTRVKKGGAQARRRG